MSCFGAICESSLNISTKIGRVVKSFPQQAETFASGLHQRDKNNGVRRHV